MYGWCVPAVTAPCAVTINAAVTASLWGVRGRRSCLWGWPGVKAVFPNHVPSHALSWRRTVQAGGSGRTQKRQVQTEIRSPGQAHLGGERLFHRKGFHGGPRRLSGQREATRAIVSEGPRGRGGLCARGLATEGLGAVSAPSALGLGSMPFPCPAP